MSVVVMNLDAFIFKLFARCLKNDKKIIHMKCTLKAVP